MTQVAEKPEGDLLAALSQLIDDRFGALAARLEGLEERVQSQAEAVPRFIKTEAPEDPIAMRRRAFEEALGDKNVVKQLEQSYPITSEGERVDVRLARPKFNQGDAVRINPSSKREGFPKAGDPFPSQYLEDGKGRKTVNRDWRRWTRLFPEAKDVFPRDVTWADILAISKNNGAGVVKSRPFLGKVGFWKYKVFVKGFPGMKPTGDGFYDYELEAA